MAAIGVLALVGCRAPGPASPEEQRAAIRARHQQLYGDADLPRKLGGVENCGLQIPAVSPDGQQLLYLRTDLEHLSPLTLLGATDAASTPTDGTLSVWLRPVAGTAPGRRLSQERWAHSPVWAPSGRAVAFVVNEPPVSYLVHVELATGMHTALGVPEAVHCLPRFDGDDQTLLFCAGDTPDGPFRVYRQGVADALPTPLTAAGLDCVLPVMTDGRGGVLCAQVLGDELRWVEGGVEGVRPLGPTTSLPARAALVQLWAGISAPLAPNRNALLFYDPARDRVSVLHVAERLVRWHRPRSIAACWCDEQTIALATADGAFVANTQTGDSISIFNGQWIPAGFVAHERRLILLGSDTPGRFALWELTFKAQPETPRGSKR